MISLTITGITLQLSVPEIEQQLATIIANQETIMSEYDDIKAALTALEADLVAQNAAMLQLLTAVANQTITPPQAKALITSMTADDATAKSNIATLQAALAGLAGSTTPTITSITPGTGANGASVPITIVGTGFAAGQAVTASDPGVTVSAVSVVSPTQITCTLAIGAAVAVGNVGISVGGSAPSNFAVTAAGGA